MLRTELIKIKEQSVGIGTYLELEKLLEDSEDLKFLDLYYSLPETMQTAIREIMETVSTDARAKYSTGNKH